MSRELWRAVVALLFAALVIAVVAKTLFGPRPGRGPERPDAPAARGAPADGTTRPGPEPPTADSSPGLPPAGPSPGEALGVRPPAIAGIVLGPDSAPLPGAIAILWEVREPSTEELAQVALPDDLDRLVSTHARSSAERTTDSSGRFAFPVAAGTEHAVEVRSPASPARVVGILRLRDDEILPLEIRLEAGLEVRGNVRTAAGAATPGAEIEAVRDERDSRDIERLPTRPSGAADLLRLASACTPRRGASDGSGAFVLHGLEPGRYSIEARHERLGFGQAIGVQAGETDVTIHLGPVLGIEGRVVLPDGSPASGVTVEPVGLPDDHPWTDAELARILRTVPAATRPLRTTDARGRFQLPPIATGRSGLLVRGAGIQRRLVEVTAGESSGPALEIVVQPGRALRGRVVDPQGRGVGGAEVEIEGADSPDFHRLGTDREGRFSCSSLLDQVHWARVRPPPPWTATETQAVPADDALLIPVHASPLVLGGRVIDETRAAVPGACLRAAPTLEQALPMGRLEARTDADGRFELRCEAPVTVRLVVEAKWFVRTDAGEFALDPSRPLADFEVPIRRAGWIEGFVRDSRGEPIPGVRVGFLREERDGLSVPIESFALPAISGTDGGIRLSLDRARAGADYMLRATRPGFLPADGLRVRVDDPTRDVRGVEIVLEPEARIHGTVRGPEGAPVQGARIAAIRILASEPAPGEGPGSASPEPAAEPSAPGREASATELVPETGFPEASATTSHRGSFELGRLPAGRYRIHANAKGLAERTVRVSVAAGEETEVEISFGPEILLGGRIVDQEGRPVSGAWIEARVAGDYGPVDVGQVGDCQSAGDGTWRIGELPADGWTYDVLVFADGHATEVLEGVAAPNVAIDVALRRLATLEVVPRDIRTGEPVGSARVRLLPAREDFRVHDPVRPEDWTEDRDEGALSAVRVPPGPYRLVVGAPGYIEHESALEVAPGSDERVEVALDPGESISGTVVDGQGRGIEGAIVEVERAGSAGAPAATRGEGFPATTDGLGRFRLGGLTVGAYRVVASHADRLEGSTGPVEVGPGAPAAVPIVIALGDGATVTGTVRGRDGRPVAGGFVKLRGTRAGKLAAVGDDGRFELRGVGPGTHALRYAPSGGADRATESPVTVEPGIAAVETEIVAE